jgi:hypothetical protein
VVFDPRVGAVGIRDKLPSLLLLRLRPIRLTMRVDPIVLHCSLRRFFLQINLSSWPSNVGTPMVRIDRIFLVDIGLKELVVSRALEVLDISLLLPPIRTPTYSASESLHR